MIPVLVVLGLILAVGSVIALLAGFAWLLLRPQLWAQVLGALGFIIVGGVVLWVTS